MFIKLDMKCPTCSAEYPNVFVKKAEVEDQRCGKCKDTLIRLPSATRTTFRFADSKLKG